MLIHPDRGSTESWTAEGDVEKMREEFKEFEPRYVLSADDSYNDSRTVPAFEKY